MDRLDILLLKILERQPRISAREIAPLLGISSPAVQRRMFELERTGRIGGYFAFLHPQVLSGSVALVHGVAPKPISEKAINIITKQGSVRRIIYYSDGRLIATLFCRSTADLNEIIGIMQEECHITDAEVLLLNEIGFTGATLNTILTSNPIPPQSMKMEPIDFAILNSLKNEARKSIVGIANELDISPRTAHNHLSTLIASNQIILEVRTKPIYSGDIRFVLRVNLISRRHRKEFLSKLLTVSDYVDRYISFDNALRLILVDGFATNMQDLDAIVNSLAVLPGVESVFIDVMMADFNFDTWIEYEVNERARKFKFRLNPKKK